MINNKIRKEIIFTEVHEDIVNEMIDNIPGINSFSEAIRYAVLSMEDQTEQQKKINDMQRKINTISKNIDILIEMTAGGFDKQDVNIISKKAKDTFIYQDAIKNVENEIQKSTTIKSNFKKANIEQKPQLEEKKFQPSKPLFR